MKILAKFTVGALFAGMGGFCAGFKHKNFQTLWASDINEACRLPYEVNFGNQNSELKFGEDGDIRKLSGLGENGLRPVDILHAGFPCQSFSIAGKREGFNDAKGNGRLMFEIFRLIEEWNSKGDSYKPRIIVFENTPNFLTGNGGEWFRKFCMELTRIGYWFSKRNAFEIDTQADFGMVQNRKRAFMIALSRGAYNGNRFDFTKSIKKYKQNLDDILENQVDGKYFLKADNRYFKEIMASKIDDNNLRLYHYRKYRVRPQKPNHCPTLPANMGAGGHNVPFIITDENQVRKLTERECLRLQGFEDNYIIPNNLLSSKLYQMIGNSVSPVVSKAIASEILNFFEAERFYGQLAV